MLLPHWKLATAAGAVNCERSLIPLMRDSEQKVKWIFYDFLLSRTVAGQRSVIDNIAKLMRLT